MRNHILAVVLASALAVSAAHAAPFGPASHRLGGGTTSAKPSETAKPINLVEAILGFIGFDLSASVEPVAGETYVDQNGKTQQCDETKKSEVAKAETKEDAQGGSSKGRTRNGDPVYLAF